MLRTRMVVGSVLPVALLAGMAMSGTAWAAGSSHHVPRLDSSRHAESPDDLGGSGSGGSDSDRHSDSDEVGRDSPEQGSDSEGFEDSEDSEDSEDPRNSEDSESPEDSEDPEGTAHTGGGRGGAAGENATSCPLALGFSRGPRRCGSPTARDGAAGAAHERY